MHIAKEIVRGSERNGFCFEFKIVQIFRINVGCVDCHEHVTVCSFLLVIEAKGMLKFCTTKQQEIEEGGFI